MRKKLLIGLCLLFSQTFLFGQVKVTFKTESIPVSKTPGKNIFVAGDFNNWNPADTAWMLKPDETGAYVISKSIPAGKYNFKVTKGGWETVECKTNGQDIDNRYTSLTHDTTIVMDIQSWKNDHPAAAKKHTASANVRIVSENFDMPQLGRQRRIWIYLPADYATSHKKYPVIYMHDGQNLFDEYTSGYGEWGIDELMDKLPVQKQCIIVGVDHGGDYRMTEYSPYDTKYGKGRGDDYVDFLVKTLKPYIDKNYRTQKDARHTTVAGSSMGGLISTYAIFKYPDVFGNAGIFSPSFWIAPKIYDYASQQSLKSRNRFYFVCGDSESDSMVGDMKKMADILYTKGISEDNAPTTIMIGAKHNEKQWNNDFMGFYNWLLAGY